VAKRRNLSHAERMRRSALMKKLNAEKRCGGIYGKLLGGRPRLGESPQAALERRRRAVEVAGGLAKAAQRQPVVHVPAQRQDDALPSDERQQVARVFAKGQPSGRYRSDGWRV
jgi:hypothetical protein